MNLEEKTQKFTSLLAQGRRRPEQLPTTTTEENLEIIKSLAEHKKLAVPE